MGNTRSQDSCRRVTRRKFLTVLAGGAVSAVAATAPTPKPALSATPAPAVIKRLPELAVAIDSHPVSLDPRLTTPTQAYPIVHHFNEPLTFRETNGKVLPWLAESWTREGELLWKLNLRRNVKFTNGEPFDAESAKYSLDCIVTPNLFPKTTAQKRNWLKLIERVDIVDANTIAIKTHFPSRSMLSYLSVFGMLPPRHSRELGDKYSANPVGTGAYKVVDYMPGNRLVFEANKNYWGGAPAQNKLTMRFISEGSTRVAALEAGEVGMINNVPPDQIERIKSNPKLDIAETMITRVAMLCLMCNRPPFQDVRVRRAVNHAIDKESIVKALLAGHGTVPKSCYAPSILYFKEQPTYEFNLEKAKKLLAEAGMAPGTPVKFGHSFGRFINDKQISQTLGQQLEKLGFSVTTEMMEWGVYREKLPVGYFDCFVASEATITLDPDWSMYPYYKATYYNKYQNLKVDELIEQGDKTFNPQDAENIYQQAQSLVWQDAPSVWIAYLPGLHGVSKKLRNYRPRPDEWFLFKDVYLEA